jgi:hypothetical protein
LLVVLVKPVHPHDGAVKLLLTVVVFCLHEQLKRPVLVLNVQLHD